MNVLALFFIIKKTDIIIINERKYIYHVFWILSYEKNCNNPDYVNKKNKDDDNDNNKKIE